MLGIGCAAEQEPDSPTRTVANSLTPSLNLPQTFESYKCLSVIGCEESSLPMATHICSLSRFKGVITR